MEGVDNENMKNLGNNGPGGSRWNPTKEQINMLENLYRQGLRTPTAEQIQQITQRLRAFGHIEGKNVFYWFQNHKARQRQKQKQENLAFYNRFLHPPPLHFPPFHQNVVCSPCYIPQVQNELGFYQQQYPKVPLPAAGAFKKINETRNKQPLVQMYNKVTQDHHPRGKDEDLNFISSTNNHNQETLELFPMHPTGILQQKNYGNYENNNSTPNSSTENVDSCINFGSDDESPSGNNSSSAAPYFDFFCGKLN